MRMETFAISSSCDGERGKARSKVGIGMFAGTYRLGMMAPIGDPMLAHFLHDLTISAAPLLALASLRARDLVVFAVASLKYALDDASALWTRTTGRPLFERQGFTILGAPQGTS
jgi:hypothetical protein